MIKLDTALCIFTVWTKVLILTHSFQPIRWCLAPAYVTYNNRLDTPVPRTICCVLTSRSIITLCRSTWHQTQRRIGAAWVPSATHSDLPQVRWLLFHWSGGIYGCFFHHDICFRTFFFQPIAYLLTRIVISDHFLLIRGRWCRAAIRQPH